MIQAVEPEPLLAAISELAAAYRVTPEQLESVLISMQAEGLIRICRDCRRHQVGNDCAGMSNSFAGTDEERYFCLTVKGRREASLATQTYSDRSS